MMHKKMFDTSTYSTPNINLLNWKIIYDTIAYILMRLFHVIQKFLNEIMT